MPFGKYAKAKHFAQDVLFEALSAARAPPRRARRRAQLPRNGEDGIATTVCVCVCCLAEAERTQDLEVAASDRSWTLHMRSKRVRPTKVVHTV